MTDPYKILGISQNASDDEIKTAYRALAKKYHPDSYAGNPLHDLASEKMQEINAAYDQIAASRRGGSSAMGAGHGCDSSQFSDIRRLITANRITEAEELLDGVPYNCRDAEWVFLKGSVQYTRGWLDAAYDNFERAHNMSPENQEYRAALGQLAWQRQTGRPGGGARGTTVIHQPGCLSSCGMCNICTTLCCANMCCDCLGGCR